MKKLKFGILSDTHGRLHPDIHDLLHGCHSILHAGDVGDESVLQELHILASTYAIAGNVDYVTNEMPSVRVVDLPFGKVGMAHGHAYPTDREARIEGLMATFKPNGVRMIIHGHSHTQFLEYRAGIWILNPGAAGRPRFGVMPSVCILEWEVDRDLLRFDFHPLDWSR